MSRVAVDETGLKERVSAFGTSRTPLKAQAITVNRELLIFSGEKHQRHRSWHVKE